MKTRTLKEFFQLGKILLGDRWWDSSYFESLMLFKLKQMSEKFFEYGYMSNSKKIAAEIRFFMRRFNFIRNLDNIMYIEHTLRFPNKPEKPFRRIETKDGWFVLEMSDEMKAYRATPEGQLEEKESSTRIARLYELHTVLRGRLFHELGKKIYFWND